MQQRVGLARALAAETDILLMDEAFSALDPLIRREMQDLLLDLQGRLDKTIVFITHDLNEAMRLGDRIAMLRNGRIMQIGTAEEILTDPANDYVAQFVADVDRTRVLTARSVMEKPIAVVDANGGPRAAVRVMRENQSSAAFVLARDRRLLGAVRAEPAAPGRPRGRDRPRRADRDRHAAGRPGHRGRRPVHAVRGEPVPGPGGRRGRASCSGSSRGSRCSRRWAA